MMFTVHYEIATSDNQTVVDDMIVEADSEERATEYATHVLDEKYDDSTLLECQVVK